MTVTDFVRRAAGDDPWMAALTGEEANFLLWSASAYPFAPLRAVWYQLRHSLRHRVCIDQPGAHCGGKKWWRYV